MAGGLRGLSPRARGNQRPTRPSPLPAGTIPACTGEPRFPTASRCRRWDYPRVHGGTRVQEEHPDQAEGLSPRARGNQGFYSESRHWKGTIPACTGEPQESESGTAVAGDYPCVHGGTSQKNDADARPEGLSPRARGNPAQLSARRVSVGTIPACTGEPLHHRLRYRSHRDYPRVHGGTAARALDAQTDEGLSPRARGNLGALVVLPNEAGTIPACTGEPARRRLTTCARRDYPRVHGGTLRADSIGLMMLGLSPRARGNHRIRP